MPQKPALVLIGYGVGDTLQITVESQRALARASKAYAVSPIDAVVCQTGLDVGTFGLQVFDAQRVVAREQQFNPGVPLLLLQLAGVAATEAGVPLPSDADAYAPLGDYLARFYPVDHTVTHLTYGADRGGIASVPLDRFSELVPNIGAGSTLFVDLARQQRPAEQPAKSG